MSRSSRSAPLLLSAPIAFSLLAFLPTHPALANCAFMGENSPIQISIDKSHAPVFDGSGTPHPGCILESSGKVVGYTSYDYLCRAKPEETFTVLVNPACCDTGPDSGDLPCTVRTRNMLGMADVRGNGDSIVPAGKDVRALDDLIAALSGDYPFSHYGAAAKFVQYFEDPAYKSAALARKSDLLKIFSASHRHEGKNFQQRGMVAYVLLVMGENADDATAGYIVAVLESEPVFAEISSAALSAAAALPEQSDKTVPAILYYLKRKYHDEDQVPSIFSTLEALAPRLEPYMKDILAFEYEWSYRGEHYDFENREAYWTRMNKLACVVSPAKTVGMERDHVKYGWKFQPFQCGN